jgi:metal-responsive CopG/Arc/MetJ family transcriptional regulator
MQDRVSRKRERMVLVSFHVPQTYIDTINELVRRGVYPSRSEAVRAAIRELLGKYRPKTAGGRPGSPSDDGSPSPPSA